MSSWKWADSSALQGEVCNGCKVMNRDPKHQLNTLPAITDTVNYNWRSRISWPLTFNPIFPIVQLSKCTFLHLSVFNPRLFCQGIKSHHHRNHLTGLTWLPWRWLDCHWCATCIIDLVDNSPSGVKIILSIRGLEKKRVNVHARHRCFFLQHRRSSRRYTTVFIGRALPVWSQHSDPYGTSPQFKTLPLLQEAT